MKTWSAFFSDYRDLSIGTICEQVHFPSIMSNMGASFEVVAKPAYDEILEENRILKEKMEGTNLEDVFQKKFAELSVAKKAELFDMIMKI